MKTDPRELVRQLIIAIGDDPDRPGLQDTPRRVVESWGTLFAGYDVNPVVCLKQFEDDTTGSSLVVVRDIPFYSTCEHHLLPIHGMVSVGYLNEPDKVIGLSKVTRVIEGYSRRLQLQERLTKQVADALATVSRFVIVQITGTHLCVASRGVMSHGQTMVTKWITTSRVIPSEVDQLETDFYRQLSG